MKGIRAKILREAPLSNNCPECFNQDMTLSFTQQHRETRFIHKVYRGVTRELRCNTCQNLIYPVTWTEDIERSVEYYEKLVQPERPGVRLKPLFYLVVALVLALAGIMVYLYLSGLLTV